MPGSAAIASAIYDATGARVRELPITPERVLQALESSEATRYRHHRPLPERQRPSVDRFLSPKRKLARHCLASFLQCVVHVADLDDKTMLIEGEPDVVFTREHYEG